MKKIGFILGRESDLSKAEVLSVYSREKIDQTTCCSSREVLILETERVIPIDEFGGTIKIFEILASNLERSGILSYIEQNISPNQGEKRINFGISGYGNIDKNFIYSVGKKLKDKYIEDGLKSRFVTGKFKDLSSVIVHENKLIERGFELILVENKGKFMLGRTIEVQDYKKYSKIDYGRPKRDEKSGMLPPKLAKILINLAETPKNKTLYDPFCGSGTILSEALLGGYKDVYGSDYSQKAIDDSGENLRWIEQKFNTYKLPAENLFVSDILNPSKEINTDAIVGEGYLGEPVRRNLAQAKEDAKNLAEFYLKALTNIGRMLNKDGRVVLAVPFFIIGKERVFLPMIDRIVLTGLKQVKIPNTTMTLRNTFTYARPDSFVGREIIILEA